MTLLQTATLPVPHQPAEMLGQPVPTLDMLADPAGWLEEYGGSVEILITHAMRGAATDLLAKLPRLKLIANFGAGVDLIDLDWCRAHDVDVTASGDLLTDDVADLAIWQILSLLRGIGGADRFVRSGRWLDGSLALGRSAWGRKLGILGFGRIGQAIARRGEVLNMTIGYHSRSPVAGSCHCFHPDKLMLARWADIVVIALPGGELTQSFVDCRFIDALGSGALLVNISRGSVIDEDALVAALREGRLGGAALDVFRHEPAIGGALIEAPNLLLTPHMGSATCDARLAMLDHVVGNVRNFQSHGPLSGLIGSASLHS